MKILLLNEREHFDEEPLKQLSKNHKVILYQQPTIDMNEIINKHSNADILIVTYIELSKEVLQKFTKLKAIILTTTAVEYIDLEYADERGIEVVNTLGYTESAVAEHLLALLLSVSRQIPRLDKYSKLGDFEQFDKIGFELAGKTLGILGMGSIGQRFALLLNGLSMNTIYSNRTPKNVPYSRVSIDDLFKTSDVIAVTLPLNQQTENLINKKTISMMKNKSIIVSISPDKIFNIDDLIKANEKNKFFGLGLDLHHPQKNLYEFDNVIITPTKAWFTKECMQRRTQTWLNNLYKFINN